MAGNKRYVKGRMFEYKVRDALKEKGYVVFRCASSRPVDLIALRPNEVLLVECKTEKRIDVTQLDRQIELAKQAGAKLIYAFKEKKGIEFRQMFP